MRHTSSPLHLALLAAVALAGPAAAQSARLPLPPLPLTDMSAFRSPPSSWRVVGGVQADRHRAKSLTATAGTGILANLPGEGRGADLFTRWEHGDLELELEVMLPQGSNSGIYLQGRYEVQLLDSWRARSPGVHDMGALYERWDDARPAGSRGYEGHPPRLNASRAPGLWQQMRIVFRAPRFDARGRKTANARFERVTLNGSVLHDNVEMTGPTRGSSFADERPMGPLRIQGDHGPVAFRNVRYRRFGTRGVRVSDLRYRLFEGQHADVPALEGVVATRQGTAEAISTANLPERFVLAYDGMLEVPTAGRYLFDLGLFWSDSNPAAPGAAARLTVGGREVLAHRGPRPSGSAEVELTAGRHPFQLVLLKNTGRQPRLAFHVEGPDVARQPLFDTEALPASPPPGAITVQAAAEPTVLRGFVRFGDAKRTHAVSVGDPAGVHFSYDLAQGAVLQAWRGPFLEATQMWHSRGEDQTVTPLGSALTLSGAPALARLQGPEAPWPDSVGASTHRMEGYTLDGAGRPTFLYSAGPVRVQDRVLPADSGLALRRELRLSAPQGGGDGLYLRIAEGSSLRRLPDGSYAVDDFRYYVAPEGGAEPVVRERAGRHELLLPVRFQSGEAVVAYRLVW